MWEKSIYPSIYLSRWLWGGCSVRPPAGRSIWPWIWRRMQLYTRATMIIQVPSNFHFLCHMNDWTVFGKFISDAWYLQMGWDLLGLKIGIAGVYNIYDLLPSYWFVFPSFFFFPFFLLFFLLLTPTDFFPCFFLGLIFFPVNWVEYIFLRDRWQKSKLHC